MQNSAKPVQVCMALGAWLQFAIPKSCGLRPRYFGGVALLEFLIVQGIKGLELFLGHICVETEVRQIVQVGLEYLCHISGASIFPLQDLHRRIAYDLEDWFIPLRKF